jgi:hypothetical protein
VLTNSARCPSTEPLKYVLHNLKRYLPLVPIELLISKDLIACTHALVPLRSSERVPPSSVRLKFDHRTSDMDKSLYAIHVTSKLVCGGAEVFSTSELYPSRSDSWAAKINHYGLRFGKSWKIGTGSFASSNPQYRWAVVMRQFPNKL